MSWISRCSWCGGPFNGGYCRHCTNVSFEDEPVYDSNSNSYNQTPDFSYQPSQPQASSLNQRHCFYCKGLLEEGENCQRCTCKRCGSGLSKGFCHICASRDENSSINNLNSFNDTSNVFTHPPQPEYETYSCELCGNDSHYGYDCPPRFPLVYEQEPWIKDYRNEKIDIRFRRECEDTIHDLKESAISLNETISQEPSSIANTPILPTLEPEDSLIIGNEELSTILEKESDEFIKSSVEDLILIPSEFEDTSRSDKDNVSIYSNSLFEIDDEYISSDINPLFDEVLENIEIKDSYDFNLDEPDLLVTPLSDDNEDECFDSGGDVDEINDFKNGYYHSEGDILYLESLLSDDTTPNLPPKVFLDRDLRSLSDAHIDNLISEDKVFNPGICVKKFSPTYVSFPFKDRHDLFFTYVV
uniref:CCHC-type domain-containing protein n=1 Tax=Tanacetum cinerariifolium TaxID=118510 RepID=A0A699HKW6_TANCI|nr:hypothetical protein [Tanacetum cinerariifolium]